MTDEQGKRIGEVLSREGASSAFSYAIHYTIQDARSELFLELPKDGLAKRLSNFHKMIRRTIVELEKCLPTEDWIVVEKTAGALKFFIGTVGHNFCTHLNHAKRYPRFRDAVLDCQKLQTSHQDRDFTVFSAAELQKCTG